MRGLNFFIIAAVFLTGIVFPCVSSARESETVDLYMSKAILAMNVGDYARAYSWFAKVVAVEPENVNALYLQGVTASRLGRFEAAEEILKKCIQLEKRPPVAHYDLGYVLYSEGKYLEAVVQFRIALALKVDQPALAYYTGAALYHLGDYEKAVEILAPNVENVPEVVANAHFYLASSYFAMGKFGRAQRHFEKCSNLSPKSAVGRKAHEMAVAALREQQLAKWWEIRFEMGGAFDSNVLYEPEDVAYEISEEEGFYGYTAFQGLIFPIRNRRGNLGVGYNFYQSIHLAAGNDLLTDFDVQSHAGQIQSAGRLFSKNDLAIYAGFDYEFMYSLLGGSHYEDQNEFVPYVTLVESTFTATKIAPQVQLKQFPEYPERDSMFFGPSLTQMFNFMHGKGKAAVEVQYQQNDAESDNYDYQGIKGFGGAVVPVYGDFSAILGLQFRYLDYLHNVDGRIDRKVTSDLGFRYDIGKYFATMCNYRYARNQSIDTYTWQKHVASLSFLFAY